MNSFVLLLGLWGTRKRYKKSSKLYKKRSFGRTKRTLSRPIAIIIQTFRHDVHTPTLHPTHLNLHRKEQRTENQDHTYLWSISIYHNESQRKTSWNQVHNENTELKKKKFEISFTCLNWMLGYVTSLRYDAESVVNWSRMRVDCFI